MHQFRKWLEERADAGVREVRVNTVLKKLDELVPGSGRNGRRVTIIPGNGDLVGSDEAARILRVDRTRPSKWRKNETTFGPDKVLFPEPVEVLATGPVFLRSEVEALIPFVEERRRF